MKIQSAITLLTLWLCGCARPPSFVWPEVDAEALVLEATHLCSNTVPAKPAHVMPEDWTPAIRTLNPVDVFRDEHVVVIALATGAQHHAVLVAPDRRDTWGLDEQPEVIITRIAPGVFKGSF